MGIVGRIATRGLTRAGISDVALNLTVRGVRQYQAWERRKRREMRRAMRLQMREVGKLLRKEARQQAKAQGLVGDRERKRPWAGERVMRPGTLVRGIGFRVFFVGKDATHFGGNEYAVTVRSGRMGFYGRFHELGYTHRSGATVTPRPFLAPALRRREGDVEEIIGRSLRTWERAA